MLARICRFKLLGFFSANKERQAGPTGFEPLPTEANHQISSNIALFRLEKLKLGHLEWTGGSHEYSWGSSAFDAQKPVARHCMYRRK